MDQADFSKRRCEIDWLLNELRHLDQHRMDQGLDALAELLLDIWEDEERRSGSNQKR